jgi:hypothetical protein
MSTVNLTCVSCGKVAGEASIHDLPYISNNTCWACADKAEYAEFKAWECESDSFPMYLEYDEGE